MANLFPTMDDFVRGVNNLGSRLKPGFPFDPAAPNPFSLTLPRLPETPAANMTMYENMRTYGGRTLEVPEAVTNFFNALAPFFVRTAPRSSPQPHTNFPLEEAKPDLSSLGPAPALAVSHSPAAPTATPPFFWPGSTSEKKSAASPPVKAADPAEQARLAAQIFAAMGFVPKTVGENLAPSEMGMPSNLAPKLLPANFWNRHPGVSGGVLRVEEGPKAGKVYTMFENAPRPKNVMEAVQPLIADWQNRLAALMQNPNANMLAVHNLATVGSPIYQLMMAGQAGDRLPSEIARNLADAARPQVVPNVYSGPGGQVSSFLVPTGGNPTPFATGVHPGGFGSAGGHRPEDYIMNVLMNAEKEISAASKDPLIASDPARFNAYIEGIHDRARNTINMIPKIFGGTGTAPAASAGPAPGVTYEAYYKAAKAKFPQATEDQILRTYQKEVLGR